VKRARNITDRAARYRANRNAPDGPRKCAFCGSRRNIGVDHIDGHEEHGEPDNLMFLCKSCNTAKGISMRNAGVGRLTRQYNPTRSGGAATLGEWVRAVGSIVPHRGAQYAGQNYGLPAAMPVGEAVAMIRATPKSRRQDFGAQLSKHRSGRRSANPGGLFARCVEEVSARGGAVDPRAVCGAAGRKKYGQREMTRRSIAGRKRARSNPAAESHKAYEEFHGHEPEEHFSVSQKVHLHKHLAGAGFLTSLAIDAIDGKHRVTLHTFKGALLAFNEKKNQLFIRGGDQRVNLKDFGIRPSEAHEVETLGKAHGIGYDTRKDHLGSEGGQATYTHVFRTTNENGKHVVVKMTRCPDVIYEVPNEQLIFSGGSYKIRREGIDL
jgi:HNH endonuclease